MRRLILLFIWFSMGFTAQTETPKPLQLPLPVPPGPSTWLFGQPYGNTTGAYNFGTAWYSAGQGLHFGIDLSMPCDTPLVAVADGEVIYVDNLTFGAGPHNLILRHPDAGITTLYGHMRRPPPLTQFQSVKRGDIVGYSGDPDLTCDSRPHLHFEVRSLDYRTAYNPLDYIDAPWHVLGAIGSYSQPSFQQDLTNPQQWMSLDDQPPIAFGGVRLNAYTQTWPPGSGTRPSPNPPLVRAPVPLDESANWGLRPLTYGNCCAFPWWSPTDSEHVYVVDGTSGTSVGIFEWDLNTEGLSALVGDAPRPQLSADGTYQIVNANGGLTIRRLSDGIEWLLNTGGAIPTLSADNTHLLWLVRDSASVPGATPPRVEIWVSDLDGNNARQLFNQPEISASWLDGTHLLISTDERTLTTLSVYDTRDNSSFVLGTWDRMRGLSTAPGGGRLMFYLTFQPDPATDGIYIMNVESGASPQKISWFGAWRWRDADSLYYIPYDPSSGIQMLAYYHIPTGESRMLTDPASQPFTIANGDWSVSPDGRRIVFMNVTDRRLWLLEQVE